MTTGRVRAATLVAPGRYEIRDYPLPEPAPGCVLVKMALSGICGTDKHAFQGYLTQYAGTGSPKALPLPIIQGHENVGTIAAIGLPALAHVFPIFPVGIVATLLLALVGFGVGFLLPSLFSSKGSRRSGHGPRGNGFIFGPGNGGHWHASGGNDSDGGFSGGGGSFGGGGASGDW